MEKRLRRSETFPSKRDVKIGKTGATARRFGKFRVIWREVLQKRRESGYTEEAFFPRRRFAKSPLAHFRRRKRTDNEVEIATFSVKINKSDRTQVLSVKGDVAS
jgi:hypothetical protein